MLGMNSGRKFAVASVKRTIKHCMIICWSTGLVSLMTMGYIETAAIWQPKHPDPVYQYPRQIKGTVRYITVIQNRILSIAMPGFVGGLAGFLLLAIPYEALRRREEKERMQRLLGGE
jgi:hypothetical protein